MKESFDGLKREIDKACAFMRSFTLGRQGFTRRDGVAAVGRVGDLCERMREFESGGQAKETTLAVASAKKQILAAQARIDLMQK